LIEGMLRAFDGDPEHGCMGRSAPARLQRALSMADEAGLDIPATIMENEATLLFELVLKNLYILTTNIAGLEAGSNVQQLWLKHNELACEVAGDVLDIQEYLSGEKLNRTALIEGMLRAFDGDPEHGCMGRSAPARLQRALSMADEAGLDIPTLRRIASANS